MSCQLAKPPTILSHGAESFGDLYAKTMICESRDGGQFALTNIPVQIETGNTAGGVPVLMTSGMFTGRGFWVSPRGLGIVAELASRGFDVYILERRDLGQSPKNMQARAGLNQAIMYDLPAVQGLIAQRNPQKLFLMGHSFGGVMMAASLATKHMNQENIAGLVMFGSQLTVDKPFLNPIGSWLPKLLCKILGYFPSKRLKMGPYNEPPAAMLDAINWVSAAKARGEFVFWKGFSSLSIPVLSHAGGNDTVDPPAGVKALLDKCGSADKTYRLLGKADGYSADYDHVGMVVSKGAAAEIWPAVAEWMLMKKN